MNNNIDLSKLTLEEINQFEITKEEFLKNQDFLDFLENYKLNNAILKRKPKTLDELIEIGHQRRIKAKLSDDIMFGLFCQDIEVCTRLLQVFLKSKNIKIGDIERIEKQKTIEFGVDIRGVRLDIFVKDNDRVYTIEMQVGTQKELALRLRGYQSAIDVELLPKGAKVSLLKESYIIFICVDYDPFNREKVEYPINHYTCIDGDDGQKEFILVDTKAHWVVFNVNAFDTIESDEDELKSIFAYIKGVPIKNDFTEYIDNHFQKIKLNKEMGLNYMITTLRDIEKYELGREEGREEGRAEMRGEMQEELRKELHNQRTKTINRMLQRLTSNEEIHEFTGYSIEEIQEVRDNYTN